MLAETTHPHLDQVYFSLSDIYVEHTDGGSYSNMTWFGFRLIPISDRY